MPCLARFAATGFLLTLAFACGNPTPSTGAGNPSTSSSGTNSTREEDASGGAGTSSSPSHVASGGENEPSNSSDSSARTNFGGSSAKDRSNAGGSSSKSQTNAGGSSSKSQTNTGGGSSKSQTNTGGSSSKSGSSSSSQASLGGSANVTSSSSGGIPVTATVPIGPSHTGEITFYDDVGDGTCMFGVTGEVDVAALAIGSWDSAAWCGACADVTGPKGTVRVRVVNQCPSCGGTWDLDLNKPAFLKIQEEKVGRFSVTWNFVACGIDSPVTYRFKEGSSPGWVGVLVDNLNLPITKFEWSTDQTTWTEAQRQSYNYFESASGFGPNYVYVRITAVDGQVLNDRLPVARPALVVTGQANFQVP